MSEYQYYEFQAIDRPLTDRHMRELRAISSRAAISRTRFSNYYTFGDLKANPRSLLVRYFDASLSFANWLFVELAFRYPKSAVDVKALQRFVAGQSLDVHSKGADVVITMSVELDDPTCHTSSSKAAVLQLLNTQSLTGYDLLLRHSRYDLYYRSRSSAASWRITGMSILVTPSTT